MEEISIYFPKRLVFGKGKVQDLKDEISRLAGKKILIITIDPLLGAVTKIREQLQEQAIEVSVD